MHICTRKTVKTACNKEDFVAQLVEQLTLNQWAVGSSPTEVTENEPLTKVGGFLFILISIKYIDNQQYKINY